PGARPSPAASRLLSEARPPAAGLSRPRGPRAGGGTPPPRSPTAPDPRPPLVSPPAPRRPHPFPVIPRPLSPQLQSGEAEQREDEGHDPEADDDLRLLPAHQLEVVVQGRHAEDALAAQLEGGHLQDDGQGLDHEQAAD